jgi:hypothetical protein
LQTLYISRLRRRRIGRFVELADTIGADPGYDR